VEQGEAGSTACSECGSYRACQEFCFSFGSGAFRPRQAPPKTKASITKNLQW